MNLVNKQHGLKMVFCLGVTVCLLFFPFSHLNASDLESTGNRILDTLEDEIDLSAAFADTYERASFETESGINSFHISLLTYKKSFNSFLSTYNSISLPKDTPLSLATSLAYAINGTNDILNGLESLESALQSYSNIQLGLAEDKIYEGYGKLDDAANGSHAICVE